jgi:trans-aconitate 2-methyltransferase
VTREWDAGSYDRLPIPMTGWGARVLDRLDLRGDEVVLDAGCGTGRVTGMLRDRLPSGEVIALDASAAMIEAARERLGDDRINYVHHDLSHPLPIDAVDAVLSTATFHWVLDHDALFANLATVMRAGAPLVAQCGGRGNLATVVASSAALGHDLLATKRYASPDETEERLRAAGFTEIACWLTDEPTPLPPDDLEEYLATVVLGTEIAGMDPAQAEGFVHEVASALDEPVLDYVRLNIDARRSG